MKKYLYIAAAAVAVALVGAIIWMGLSLKDARKERDRYHRNSDALLSEIDTYKTKDSLNAARVQGLELKMSEYKKFMAEDAKLIASLKTKVKDLDRVVKSQNQTIYQLHSVPVDTVIVYKDTVGNEIKEEARAVHCGDAWYDFDGVITKTSFTGKMESRDSIVIAESIEYKRFLGFLWKTKRIKNRTMDVVSKNPHTKVLGANFITIEK